jgi:hypothetical protein
VLKGQDVVVLLKMLGRAEPVGVRQLADELGFDAAGTHRALRRLSDAGLYSSERRRVYGAPAEEFLIHAVKFSFPAERGKEMRGIPTSWAAEPLKGELAEPVALPPVWPHSTGRVRGLSLKPLHPMVPAATQADPQLWERVSLVDALRSDEGPRITALAAGLLKKHIEA